MLIQQRQIWGGTPTLECYRRLISCQTTDFCRPTKIGCCQSIFLICVTSALHQDVRIAGGLLLYQGRRIHCKSWQGDITRLLTGHFADKLARGRSGRRLVNSWTTQLANFLKILWQDYHIGTARNMSVDIDATPDLLLLIQQMLAHHSVPVR